MENIKKSIYNLPEIRHTLKPLWSAWILVGIGLVCYLLLLAIPNPSSGLSSALWGMAGVGVMCLLIVLCYWAFGDSRRPYSRQLHATLAPTFAYYAPAMREAVVAALESHDELALEAVRRSPSGSLTLVRYSDPDERVYYSQLLDGNTPLTDIIINNIQQ